MRNSLIELVAARNLTEQVHFNNHTSDTDTVYRQALCTISASVIESFGMTLIEAMAHKTPVIATASGGPVEIIEDGVDGFLINRGDADTLAARMEQLLSDPELARTLGEGAFATVNNRFSEAVASGQFVDVITQVQNQFERHPLAVRVLNDVYALYLNTKSSAKVRRSEVISRGDEQNDYRVHEQLVPSPLASTPLTNGARLIYCLKPERQFWSGIDLVIGTHQRNANGQLILTIKDQNNRTLRQTAQDLSEIRDNAWMRFEFLPILNSQDNLFRVQFALQTNDSQTLISIYQSRINTTKERIWLRLGVQTRTSATLHCRMLYRTV